ncbi:hypothetical protein RIF29_23650 [Crotalaria pallida]|uniref:Uncharacterized protein n=1 Tax=Crotalaria pallida TaxID=3830 RepID=A0AAN9IF85_CROPI
MVAVSHEEEEVTRLVASRDDDEEEEGTQLVVLQVEVDELVVVSRKVARAPPVVTCHDEECSRCLSVSYVNVYSFEKKRM